MSGVSLCITFRSQTCGKVGITNLEIAEMTPTGRLILVMDVLKDGLDSEYTLFEYDVWIFCVDIISIIFCMDVDAAFHLFKCWFTVLSCIVCLATSISEHVCSSLITAFGRACQLRFLGCLAYRRLVCCNTNQRQNNDRPASFIYWSFTSQHSTLQRAGLSPRPRCGDSEDCKESTPNRKCS